MSIEINRPKISVAVQRPDVSVTVNRDAPTVKVNRPSVSVTVNKHIHAVKVNRPSVVVAGTRFGGLAEAPKDGRPYERQDGTWILASGAGGVSNLVTAVTAETVLSSLKLVANGTQFGKVVQASNINLTHRNNIVGVTQRSAIIDEIIPVTTEGYIQDPSWSWVRGLIYVGLNGSMTQTPPISGFIQIIGKAVDFDKIQLHLKTPITLL